MAKILVVDDESLILYSLSKMLRQIGAEVTTVTNGTDALREIHRDAYDICFLDVHLPDANGLDMTRTIEQDSPHTAIIIMTAVFLDEEQIQSLQKRGCRYLPKPFDLNRVLTLIADISGRSTAAN